MFLLQQILVVKLLELLVVELEDCVYVELLENFVFEEGKEESIFDEIIFVEIFEGEMEGDMDYDLLSDYLIEDDIFDYKFQENNCFKGEQVEEILFLDVMLFYEILREQFGECNLIEYQCELVEYLIGLLDDDGLFCKFFESIGDELVIYVGINVMEEELEEVLRIV